ncbi:FG-GAP-like repeat-containing protein [Zavarzinella formosa]|uniref:FG-GAP-like repeat-containing protein n=1 Tax=Zavarzinella formosa TaxID=360055 RepID=UPI00030E606E|nr:FG-GAP-like repeat-containing protein [Zavarzinella formosa]
MRYLVSGLAALLIVGGGVAAWLMLSREKTPDPPNTTPSAVVPGQASEPSPVLPPGVTLSFVDVTAAAGIKFHHVDGRTDMEYLTDSTGPGAAWIDYDQDGLLDLFLVQGYPILPPFPADKPGCKLYRNLGDGKFEDVTAAAGCGHVGCGQGAAVGDIDNDGFPDLFLTCVGKPNVLWHNVPDGNGGRRFEDITAQAGMADHPDWRDRPNWSTSAAFLDFDNDGKLDLFVCSYVRVDFANYPECRQAATGRRAACPPLRFSGTTCVLYRNLGDGRFVDVTAQANVDQPNAKALGVVALDLDDDGLPDLFVANDGAPNFLFRNLGGGKFERRGPSSGCAVNGSGNPQAYMGTVAADLDGDGRPDLFATAFAREANSFFRNLGGCRFLDATAGSGLGPPSWHRLGFGTVAIDVDRDGSLDLVVANGHVMAHIDLDGDPNNTFRQTPQLFLNDGRGRFQEFSAVAGPAFQKRYVGRGLALADYDNDGRVDLYLADSGGPAALLHNESTTPHHWLRLELRGTKSNRDAVGAKVTFRIGDRSLVRHREGGGSYLSAHDPRLLVGLGAARQVDEIEIRWPSGQIQKIGPLEADRGYRITEGVPGIEVRK